jgi:hypothetical protein
VELPRLSAEQDTETAATEPEPEVAATVSWRPPEDSWDRLLSVLSMQPGPAALVVHARAVPIASLRLRDQACAGLEAMEHATEEEPSFVQTAAPIPRRTAIPILEAATQKLLSLGGPLIAARVFAVGVSPLSPVLLATIGTSLHAVDTASNPLPGGIRMKRTPSSEILARLSEPEYRQFFSSEEAIAFLRTPIPVSDGKWIDAVDVCTTPLRGRSGDDAPLGVNAAHGRRFLVRMDRQTRFEHTYVVGQTGTGKSTFLLHQIMHDIGQGCGVGVLDPHGTLIEEVLRRMPAERADDVVILDPTDVARPVPFNPLAITENDPLEYRQVRALVINDLYADVEHAYAAQWGNISGPVFESHLRGVLGLLLGMDPQRLPWVPNLGLMRAVYYSSPLR